MESSQAHPYDNIMFKEPDEESTRKACKIAKTVSHALVNDTEDDLGACTDTGKGRSGEGFTFGNKGSNQYKGSRK